MSILKVSTRQVKAARALLNWSQQDLADEANVSIATVKRLESDDGDLKGREETARKLRAALQAAGIEFLEGSAGTGVRLRK
ncbi:MAG: helix-turn-helix domain-containing protein [Pseudomonadota bacterium]|nr:helix-turn-helix domain-containing protein [Afipia sp.]